MTGLFWLLVVASAVVASNNSGQR